MLNIPAKLPEGLRPKSWKNSKEISRANLLPKALAGGVSGIGQLLGELEDLWEETDWRIFFAETAVYSNDAGELVEARKKAAAEWGRIGGKLTVILTQVDGLTKQASNAIKDNPVLPKSLRKPFDDLTKTASTFKRQVSVRFDARDFDKALEGAELDDGEISKETSKSLDALKKALDVCLKGAAEISEALDEAMFCLDEAAKVAGEKRPAGDDSQEQQGKKKEKVDARDPLGLERRKLAKAAKAAGNLVERFEDSSAAFSSALQKTKKTLATYDSGEGEETEAVEEYLKDAATFVKELDKTTGKVEDACGEVGELADKAVSSQDDEEQRKDFVREAQETRKQVTAAKKQLAEKLKRMKGLRKTLVGLS
jgi:hypothetical protein